MVSLEQVVIKRMYKKQQMHWRQHGLQAVGKWEQGAVHADVKTPLLVCFESMGHHGNCFGVVEQIFQIIPGLAQ
jgi:hypothetical protein